MSEPPVKITIHDVAREAGVSIKTVSRVMRDEPKVSEETRQAVRAAAQRLDYRPHPSASALASSVSSVVGLTLLQRDSGPAGRSGFDYYISLQTGALAACEALGFGLRVLRLDGSAPDLAESLVQRVRRREVGGFVIPAPACDLPGLLDRLDEAGLVFSAMSPRQTRPGALCVAADDRGAMRAITQRVLAAGHRRIAFIRGDSGWRDTEERYAGFLDALAGAGMGPSDALVEQGSFGYDEGLACAARLLALPRRPTAIIASSDNAAAGVLACAHRLGLRLPADLSVTGFDDFDIARKVWPSLTTVHQPVEKMGELAARQVIAHLQPDRRSQVTLPQQVMVHCDVVERESLAVLPN